MKRLVVGGLEVKLVPGRGGGGGGGDVGALKEVGAGGGGGGGDVGALKEVGAEVGAGGGGGGLTDCGGEGEIESDEKAESTLSWLEWYGSAVNLGKLGTESTGFGERIAGFGDKGATLISS